MSARPSYASSLSNVSSMSEEASSVTLCAAKKREAAGLGGALITTRFAVFSGPQHYRPDEQCREYYAPLPPAHPGTLTRSCAVVYPFFNEERFELQRSLQGMYMQVQCDPA